MIPTLRDPFACPYMFAVRLTYSCFLVSSPLERFLSYLRTHFLNPRHEHGLVSMHLQCQFTPPPLFFFLFVPSSYNSKSHPILWIYFSYGRRYPTRTMHEYTSNIKKNHLSIAEVEENSIEKFPLRRSDRNYLTVHFNPAKILGAAYRSRENGTQEIKRRIQIHAIQRDGVCIPSHSSLPLPRYSV